MQIREVHSSELAH